MAKMTKSVGYGPLVISPRIYIYITTRDIHSGYVYIAIEAMTIEIVDFPIKNDDFPLFC